MSISRVSGSLNTGDSGTGGGTTHTVTAGTTPTVGNLGVIILGYSTATPDSPPDDWAVAKQESALFVYWKILTSADVADSSWDFTTPSTAGATWVYAEYASTTGWPAAPVDTSGSNSGTGTSIAVTTAASPSETDNLVIGAVRVRTNIGTVGWTNGITNIGQPGVAYSGYLETAAGEEFDASTGGTFSSTASWTTSDSFIKASIVVFKPASTLFVTPGVAQQLAQAYAPTLTAEVFVTPGVAQQLAQAFAPTFATGEVFVTPDVAQQLAQAYAPTLTAGEVFVTPGVAQSLATATAPLVRLTLRPVSTVAADGWDTGPTPAGDLDANTSDGSDATWIEDTPA